MSILAVITTFLAAFAAICSAAMVFSGFLGLLDMDDLVPAKPRDQLSRMKRSVMRRFAHVTAVGCALSLAMVMWAFVRRINSLLGDKPGEDWDPKRG